MNTNEFDQAVVTSTLLHNNAPSPNVNYLSTQEKHLVTDHNVEGVEIQHDGDPQLYGQPLPQLSSLEATNPDNGDGLITTTKSSKSRIISKHSRGHEQDPSGLMIFFGRFRGAFREVRSSKSHSPARSRNSAASRKLGAHSPGCEG